MRLMIAGRCVFIRLTGPGLAQNRGTGQRQMHMQYSEITAPSTERSMMDSMTRKLGVAIAKWLLEPVDGVLLVNGK